MILIGMFDSPFTRRVAISATLLGVAFEHRNWSVGRDFDRIREYSPLGRVPVLVLDDGRALCESALILDWLDQQAGPEHALLPTHGEARLEALQAEYGEDRYRPSALLRRLVRDGRSLVA